MNIFDIVGPVMVGPSSSHTAGAVKIGYVAGKLMGEPIKTAKIFLHGSFASTGKGHGTDLALIAGLLGMQTDDIRIPDSFEIAKEIGMEFTFAEINLTDVHPNSVLLKLTGISDKKLEIVASSLGGGRIQVETIDGLKANFSGDYPTLVVHNTDRPGHVGKVAGMLSEKSVNIAAMQLYRSKRGCEAVMVLECDQEVPQSVISWIESIEGINKVTYLSMKE